MDEANSKASGQGADLLGLGKVAKAIPPEVFEQTAAITLSTFEKLVAPITESTSGFGRYIRQKFNTMVEVEKALAAYTLEQAIKRAKARTVFSRTEVKTPSHPKSFVLAIEEAARETDPVLHAMWTELLASQLTEDMPHPYFVGVMSQLSVKEAEVLATVKPRHVALKNIGSKKESPVTSPKYWSPHVECDNLFIRWTPSCTLLINSGLIESSQSLFYTPRPDTVSRSETYKVLFLTEMGELFLSAVTAKGPS